MYEFFLFIRKHKIKTFLFLIFSLIFSGFGRLSKMLISVNLDLPMAEHTHMRVALIFLELSFYTQYSLKNSAVLVDFPKRGFFLLRPDNQLSFLRKYKINCWLFLIFSQNILRNFQPFCQTLKSLGFGHFQPSNRSIHPLESSFGVFVNIN